MLYLEIVQEMCVLVEDLLHLAHPDAAAFSASAAREHIQSACEAVHPHAADSAAFSREMRAWPGLPAALSALTASFPAASASFSSPRPDSAAQQSADTPDAPAPAQPGTQSGAQPVAHTLLPRVNLPNYGRDQPLLLLPEVTRLLLASALPDAQRQDWRLLFNSDMHGKSFASFVGRILDQGPTVLAVRSACSRFRRWYACRLAEEEEHH